jgi:uncharacterized RDD family membrane protein YckC
MRPDPATSIAPPGFTPRPPKAPDELLTGAPVDRALLAESRRRLDSRRLGACLLDNLLFVPVAVPLVAIYGLNVGTQVFIAALAMAYHFGCDVTSGQTIGKRVTGLRVVMADGSPVTERAGSARAVLRLVDFTLIGLVVYMASRGRRRRVGDYAAGTIVCEATRVGTFVRGLRPHDAGWPLAWLVPASLVLVLTVTGHTPWSYRVQADRVCATGAAAYRKLPGPFNFPAALAFAQREEQMLAAMRPPPNWRDRHTQLVTRMHAENVVALEVLHARSRRTAIKRFEALQSLAAADNAALWKLGYRDCAGADKTKTI